jgi:protein-tyrosine phosphatase
MLLFVCHANICRSPMAERLARLALSPGSRGTAVLDTAAPNSAALDTASAGTHARAGAPMHPGAAKVLQELGADASDFASRLVSADLLTQASLVLTATREQRAFCVRLAPLALRRTFTIRQFGRLTAGLDPTNLGSAPAGRMAALLDLVASTRGGLQPVEPAEDDLADPVNGTEDDVHACARQIQLSLRPALALIGPA